MGVSLDLQEPVAEKVRQVLGQRGTLMLGTAAGESPWVAGTFFAESDIFTLAIVLEKTGKTLANIQTNPRVAVVVSSGTPFEPFLQGDGKAVVLAGERELEATKNALLAKVPEVEPFLQAPIVAVSLRLRRWRVTDVPSGWLPGKELVAPESVS